VGDCRGGAELDDLSQVASIGLLKAIDRFDPSRGTSFASFAVPTIAGELKRHYRDRGWAMHVPRDLQELALRVERVARELEHGLGDPPTAAQIAERAGATVDEVLEGRESALAHHAVPLDRVAARDDDDGRLLAETIAVTEGVRSR
jgi:RNA polymerase sigma-B factor